MNNDELYKKFRELNVPDPELWADSQINEGINQLSRAKALSLLFEPIQSYDNYDTIDSFLGQPAEPDRPYGLVGILIKKILNANISKKELNYLIRCVQVSYIQEICARLDGCYEGSPTYGIMICDKVDDEGNFAVPDGLHESVFEMEGNDMVPPDDVKEQIIGNNITTKING